MQKLLRLCRGPIALPDLELATWSDIVPVLRRCGLLGRIAANVNCNDTSLAPKVRDQLVAANVLATKHQNLMVNEIVQIGKVVSDLRGPVLLLKGAAYEAQGLPNAKGRMSSDVDIMVPEECLEQAESLVLENGWNHEKLSAYDQKYYRTWMHELPPLRNAMRGTYLDLHHTIVPPTSRYSVDVRSLFEGAVEAPLAGLFTLSPTDMVLHSAVHLFSEGEFGRALRDLFDIDDLLAFYSTDSGFLEGLVERSFEVNLQRPLYYALSCIGAWFGEGPTEGSLSGLDRARPNWPVPNLMHVLFERTLLPVEHRNASHRLSAWLMFCRAHYLRMPLHLLIPHLTRKAFIGFQGHHGKAERDMQDSERIRTARNE